jgi:hypothetical protein
MGTILVPLFAHYRPAAPPVQAAYAEGLRGAERSGWRSVAPGASEGTMTTEEKIIRAKAELLELAEQFGNVSEACKMMGHSRDSFYRACGGQGSGRREPFSKTAFQATACFGSSTWIRQN